MTLVPTDERKDTVKIYEELWNKIRDLIRSVNNNSDNYDEKYMKIKFNSEDDLPLKKTIELYNMVIVVRSVFHEDNKYYPQDFLDECLYKLKMLEYDQIDMSEGIDVNESKESCRCINCNHYFLGVNVRFHLKVCSGCNDII